MNASFPAEIGRRIQSWTADRAVLARFAPSQSLQQRFEAPPSDARPAAVIVLLYPNHNRWLIPLILRTETVTHHRGQVALPGGAFEAGEEGEQAALRELSEELGVCVHDVRLLGALTPFYVPASRFVLYPFVGFMAHPPEIRPNATEVAEVLEAPVSPIVTLSSLAVESRELAGQVSDVPYFRVGAHRVWGATCIVLGEFAALAAGLAV